MLVIFVPCAYYPEYSIDKLGVSCAGMRSFMQLHLGGRRGRALRRLICSALTGT